MLQKDYVQMQKLKLHVLQILMALIVNFQQLVVVIKYVVIIHILHIQNVTL